MLKIKNINHSKIMKYFLLFLLFLFIYLTRKNTTFSNINSYEESSYFATWGTAIYLIRPPPGKLDNNSIRQIFQVSTGGEKIRIKISNLMGNNDLEIKKICIADLVSESEINKKTMKYITFNGNYNIIIEKGKEIYSDTIIYPLKTLSKIAISIYFGTVPKLYSGHLLSLTYSYIEKGNKIKKRKFSNKKKVAHWYFISLIEISSDRPKKVIVCFGDSITDGVSKTNDARNNYPGILSRKLVEDKNFTDIAVINEGIDGNRLTIQGIQRYEHDVLNIKGISYIIFLFGFNDINGLNASSTDIISSYKTIIKKAHKKNIFIYGGTILPFALYKSRNVWNKKKEKVRQEVNKWIRETKPEKGGFDSFFDFDKLLKDPEDEIKLKNIYDCGDGIHPSLEGYMRMVENIDLQLFSINQKL